MTNTNTLKVGDKFYEPYYSFKYPAPYKVVVNIKCCEYIVTDVIVTQSNKGIKVTYVDDSNWKKYKHNSKRIYLKPFTDEEALEILNKYVKYRNKNSSYHYIVGEYVK